MEKLKPSLQQQSPHMLKELPREQQPNDGHLEVIVKSCKLRNVMASEQDPIQAFFLLLQLEDQEGLAKPQKFRTDLQRQVFRSEDLHF